MRFPMAFLMIPIVLGACSSSPLNSLSAEPQSSKDYYLNSRTSYYEQKNKNLSSEEARAKAQADYNLFSDPVTGEVR